MSNMIVHYLRAPNLKQMLLDSGAVESKVLLHGTAGRAVEHQFVLNMKKCNKDNWEEVERSAIEHGVVDFSKRNADGKHGVRRDLTLQEVEELPYYPIFFENDNEVNWICKWNNYDEPAFFISKLFPKQLFMYDIDSIYDWCGQYTVVDGVFNESDEWKEHMKEMSECVSGEDADNINYGPDETLPF